MQGKGNRSLGGPLEDLARHRFPDDPFLSSSLPCAVIHSVPSPFSLPSFKFPPHSSSSSLSSIRSPRPVSVRKRGVLFSLLVWSLDCGCISRVRRAVTFDRFFPELKFIFLPTIYGSYELIWRLTLSRGL